MSRGRAVALALLIALPVAGATTMERSDSARRAVVVIGPEGSDSIRDLMPEFVAFIDEFDEGDLPISFRVQVSTRADFATTLLDEVIAGDTVRVRPTQPLPEKQSIWWRATATTTRGEIVESVVYGPSPVAGWLRLIAPNAPNGTLVPTRRPEFVWSSIPVLEPPGPWRYDLDVISVGTGRIVVMLRNWPDTTFTPATELESNTSYRWRVTARLNNGASSTVNSASTFIVTDESSPLTTLLYQNFPNPFPSTTSSVTCVWFDLHVASTVRLEIFDLRGHPVRRLVISEGALEPGRYGRAASGDPSSCDPQFSWDGTADDGRVVPSGVYLLRLRAAGAESMRRILFRGR